MATSHTHPIDSDFPRARLPRFLVMFIIVGIAILVGYFLGQTIGQKLFGTEQMGQIGRIFGAGIAALLVSTSFDRVFLIRNPTTGMFVTQDTLASLLGRKNVNIPYGPGVHIAFPWERRLAENNISLLEAANDFTFTVQCTDGTLRGKGSVRLRPDMTKPVDFLTGVAAVADEITDLFIARIIEHTSGKKMQKAMGDLKGLNEYLKGFRESVGEFNVETQFGVEITDVTVSELLPTDEVQKTLSSLTEARVIKKGTAELLGLSMAEVQRRLKAGELSPAEYNLARDRFLSISGNLEGMNINRTEFDLSVHGLSAEALKELRELAQTPAAGAVATTLAGKTKGGKK